MPDKLDNSSCLNQEQFHHENQENKKYVPSSWFSQVEQFYSAGWGWWSLSEVKQQGLI